MANILGVNDLKQYALPANWDAAYLRALQLATGETYEQMVGDIAAALNMENAGLLADPLVGSLVSTTAEAAMEYRIGVSNGFEPHTEYQQPDPKRGATTGHMLPLMMYDRGLGWTWDFLRKARRAQLDSDIASAMQDLDNVWDKMVLTRLFKSTYDSVGSGKSMPVADAGVADSTYVPWNDPDRASAFATTHTHLLDTMTITQTNLETAVAHLWEHGADGPWELLIANADKASWSNTTNVTGWIKRKDILIEYGSQTTLAQVDQDFIGVIETSVYGTVRVRASARIPTGYWSVFKSYGQDDQRNPLIVRESPQFGLGAILLSGRQFPIKQFPLEGAILFFEFGVGINDRVGAVLCQVAGGAYSSPAIS